MINGSPDTITFIQMEKIEEQRKEALKASQKALSKEEVAQMLEKAREVLSGATVQTSSMILGE